MRLKLTTLLLVVTLIASAVLMIISADMDTINVGLKTDVLFARGPDWTLADQQEFTFQLDPQNDLVISQNTSSGFLEATPSFDVYSSINETARRAVDRCPQWLNLTLCWKFAELTDAQQVTYADLLLNSSMNESYLDEIGFTLSYMPKEILTSSAFDPFCLWENVDVMYNISRELKYADIVDTQLPDGEHSTVRYRMQGGNVTLPEEIYYWYLATPRSNIELPAYINFTEVEVSDDPNLYYTDHTEGVWWRDWLYNTSHHSTYTVLRDLLLNETVLWKTKQNNVDDNGAVGAVSRWQRDLMPTFGAPGNRSHQPVVHYIHHWGMCGENSDMLAAAAKIALIPCVPSLSLEAWHGWNEFFEGGWHQWEAYSNAVDFPPNEGGYGGTSVFVAFNPDSSQRSCTRVYTDTANITVNVKDVDGLPVDGAFVNIATGSTYNNPGNIGLIGNATDAKGNVGFEVGFGHDYYIHVYSSLGQFPASAGTLVKAFTNTTIGGYYTYNVTLGGSLATNPFSARYEEDEEFGTRFNISVVNAIQPTKMHTDPFGYGHSVWKDWPNGSQLMVLILDDTNLALYKADSAFIPARVLNIPEGGYKVTTVPSDKHYNLVVTGKYQPMTKTWATINVSQEQFSGIPRAQILKPYPGTYLLGTKLNFTGQISPIIHTMGAVTYQWESNISGVLSGMQTFNWDVLLGWHNITLTVSNASGTISTDWVHFRVKHPNRGPSANISLPVEDSEYEYAQLIPFSANGSKDPDRDNMSYSWYIPSLDFEIGTSKEFEYMLGEGEFMVILTVSDPYGLNDTALVNISVLPENKPPEPVIDSPKPQDVFYNDTAVLLSAQGTWDENLVTLKYIWNSSRDGVVLSGFYGYVQLSPGNHTITLWADDGKHNVSTSVDIKIVVKQVFTDTPPVAVIASPEDGQAFFVGDIVVFDSNGSYDPEDRGLNYKWWVDGLVESELYAFSKEMPEGTYKIQLDVFDGTFWTSSDEVTITVMDRPPVIVIKVDGNDILNDLTMMDNETVTLNASGSYDPEGGSLSFLWTINDDVISAFPTVDLDLDEGSFAVILEVTDANGKISTKTVWVTVNKSNTTVEPPLQDDDIVDDDTVDDDEPGSKGFLSTGVIIALVVILLVAMFLIGMFVYIKTRKEEDIEEDDTDERKRSSSRHKRRSDDEDFYDDDDDMEWDEE